MQSNNNINNNTNNNRGNSFLHFVSMYKKGGRSLKNDDIKINLTISICGISFYGIIHGEREIIHAYKQTSTNTHAVAFIRTRYDSCLLCSSINNLILLICLRFYRTLSSDLALFFHFFNIICKLCRRSGIIRKTHSVSISVNLYHQTRVFVFCLSLSTTVYFSIAQNVPKIMTR